MNWIRYEVLIVWTVDFVVIPHMLSSQHMVIILNCNIYCYFLATQLHRQKYIFFERFLKRLFGLKQQNIINKFGGWGYGS